MISLNSADNDAIGKEYHAKMLARDAEIRKNKSKVVFAGMGGSDYRNNESKSPTPS